MLLNVSLALLAAVRNMWWSICIWRGIARRRQPKIMTFVHAHVQTIISTFTIQQLYSIDPERLWRCNSTIWRFGSEDWFFIIFFSYRKFNLFLEAPAVRQTLTPDVSVFETDFGVRFGLIICFDLNFHHPVSELLARNIENFAYPTMWFSEFPFYTGKRGWNGLKHYPSIKISNNCQRFHSGVQIQQSWAYANKVNLLAAGTSTRTTTGSGIYSGRQGVLKAIMAVAPTTRVLLAEVPKRPYITSYTSFDQEVTQQQSRSSQNIWQEKLDQYYLERLDLDKNPHQSGKICHEGTCCGYNVTASIRDEHSGSVGHLKSWENLCNEANPLPLLVPFI